MVGCAQRVVHVWEIPTLSTSQTKLSNQTTVTHSCVWHDSLICATCLIHVCDMAIWYDINCDTLFVWSRFTLQHPTQTVTDVRRGDYSTCVVVTLVWGYWILFWGILQPWHSHVRDITHHSCDMIQLCVWYDWVMCVTWHDWAMCVTWLIQTCGLTHSCAWYDSLTCGMIHVCVWQDSFICVTWLIHEEKWLIRRREPLLHTLLYVCDMTHSYVWYDSYICVTCPIHMWHDSCLSSFLLLNFSSKKYPNSIHIYKLPKKKLSLYPHTDIKNDKDSRQTCGVSLTYLFTKFSPKEPYHRGLLPQKSTKEPHHRNMWRTSHDQFICVFL